MAEPTNSIDITDVPEILRLAEEVHRVGEPRILRRHDEELAMVVPLPDANRVRPKKPTDADLAAFRSAAGSWADLDADRLKAHVYRARQEGTRPDDRP